MVIRSITPGWAIDGDVLPTTAPRPRSTGSFCRRPGTSGEGNLIELVRRCGDGIGEIQVADVPGRCQPGTGEIYYPAVAKALHDMGYRGTVSLEVTPRATTWRRWRPSARRSPSGHSAGDAPVTV